jgi:hypothetical protein
VQACQIKLEREWYSMPQHLSGGAETACPGPVSAPDARPATGASCPSDGRACAGDDAPRGRAETASSALEAAAHMMREGKSSKNGPVPAVGDGMGAQEEQDAAVNSKRSGTRPIRRYGVRKDARLPGPGSMLERLLTMRERILTMRLRCARECVELLWCHLLLTRLLAFGPPRSWSIEQRLQHRIACKSKSKLSLGQKLEIVAQHQSRDPAIRKTQVSSSPLCRPCLQPNLWPHIQP